MRSIGGSGAPGARRGASLWRMGLPGVVGGVIAGLALTLVALLTLGLALLLLPWARRRGRVRVWRFGGPGPAPSDAPHAPAAGAATADAPQPDDESGPPADAPPRERSWAEVIEIWPVAFLLALALGAALTPSHAWAKWLVPMDGAQTDHLRAYGLVVRVLERGDSAVWLLDERGGSFLLPGDGEVRREAKARGVAIEAMGAAREAATRARIGERAVLLCRAPRLALLSPPDTLLLPPVGPLVLDYAGVPYRRVGLEEVLRDTLSGFDVLWACHEDFTGQRGKFYLPYHTSTAYQREDSALKATATRAGFAKLSQLEAAVATAIEAYVARGGRLFAMCSAADSYDIALAAAGVDIAGVPYDGDPPDPGMQGKLDYSRTLAFEGFRLEADPNFFRFSDIDATVEADERGDSAVFTLASFPASPDPVPAMLVQDHVRDVPEFLGTTTGFHRAFLKDGVLVLAAVTGADEVKYLYGRHGRGAFVFLGGHEPGTFARRIGDPPRDLAAQRNSPAWRLLLNNLLCAAHAADDGGNR